VCHFGMLPGTVTVDDLVWLLLGCHWSKSKTEVASLSLTWKFLLRLVSGTSYQPWFAYFYVVCIREINSYHFSYIQATVFYTHTYIVE
jgi:hypothetical protein